MLYKNIPWLDIATYNENMFQPERELALPTEQPSGGDNGDCRAKISDIVRKHHKHPIGATIPEIIPRRHDPHGAPITEIDQRKHPLGTSQQQQSPFCEDGA